MLWSSLIPVLPELLLAVAGMALLVVGSFRGNNATSFISMATVAAFVIAIAGLMCGPVTQTAVTLNGFFIQNDFTVLVKILILTGMVAATLMAGSCLRRDGMEKFEYPVLLIFAALGMMLMVSANNFLALYVGLELQSLALYVLAAFRRSHLRAAEAGMKYFVLGALASGMMLFGISLVYGATGGIGFAISEGAYDPGLMVGMVFILAAMAFKLSAVPFHMWTPDVYEGAPSPVTALFALVPKLAAVAVLIRLLAEPFAGQAGAGHIVWFIAAGSMIVGAFAALGQTNIKRLLAYSAIGNMGYALMGVVAGGAAGAGSVLVYMALYMVMTAGVFALVLMLRRGGEPVELIADLAGQSRTQPLVAWTMALLMFSMAGIPPLAGFFGKLLVFNAAIGAGYYTLAVIGVLSSVVAAYYYLKIIKVMFFDDPASALDRPEGRGLKLVATASIVAVLLFIFMPQALVTVATQAATSLLPG